MQEQFNQGTQTGVKAQSGVTIAQKSCRRPSLRTMFSSTAAGMLLIAVASVPVLGFAAEQTKSAKSAVTDPSAPALAASTSLTPPVVAAPVNAPAVSPTNATTAIPSTQPGFITVGGYDIQIENRTEPIPFHTYMRMSKDVAPGHIKDGEKGEDGILQKQYRVFYKKGNAEKSELLATKVVKDPVDQITYCGIRIRDARALPSRSGSYDRVRELNMVATGYAPWQGSGRGLCATGARAGYGVVAVDPRVIPLHSKLYIEGYGYAIAEDTGGAIKRNRIDLGHNTYREAENVGRRTVHVYVLTDR